MSQREIQRESSLPGNNWSIGPVARGLITFARRQPLGAVGALVCLILILVAAIGPEVVPENPREVVGRAYEQPAFAKSWNSWGTDGLGRDLFSRVLAGARVSLVVGLAATFWGTTVGVVWGLLQGYWGGGWFDTLSQRFLEAKLSIPGLILALTFMSVFGPSALNVVIAIGLNYIPSGARTIRSTVLAIREMSYIDAARAMGASHPRIIFYHILPNTMSLYLILTSLHIGGAIVAESSLSFLGLGAGPDVPSWGGLVSAGTSQALVGGVPWLAIFPGGAIALTVYGFNLLGDALRDTLDPRLRGSRGR